MNTTSIVDRVINPRTPWKLPRANYRAWQPNYKRSAQYLKALFARANEADAEAEYEVACYYEYGCKTLSGKIFIRRSKQKMVDWTFRAALHGCSSAQMALGVQIGDGDGFVRNSVEAIRWLRRAHRGGCSSAANNIAITYRESGNLSRAVLWFRTSVESGDDGALIQLGIHHHWGIGTRKDPHTAVALFRKATKAKHLCEMDRDDAFFYLGVAHLQGKGARQSSSIAMKMFERANHDNDHPAAARLLKLLATNACQSLS